MNGNNGMETMKDVYKRGVIHGVSRILYAEMVGVVTFLIVNKYVVW